VGLLDHHEYGAMGRWPIGSYRAVRRAYSRLTYWFMRLLCGLLVAGVMIASEPGLSGSLRPLEPAPAEAQAGLTYSGAVAACAASNAAAAVCVGAAAFIIGYTWGGGDTVTEGAVQDLLDTFESWWSGGGDESEAGLQIEAQYISHSTYVVPTADMLEAWDSLYPEISPFHHITVGGVGGIGFTSANGYDGGDMLEYTLQTGDWPTLCAGCTTSDITAIKVVVPELRPLVAHKWSYHIYDWAEGLDPETDTPTDSYNRSNTYGTGSEAWGPGTSLGWFDSLTLGGVSTYQTDVQLRLSLNYAQPTTTGSENHLGVQGPQVWVTEDATGCNCIKKSYLDWSVWTPTPGSPTIYVPENVVFNVPLVSDSLVEATPATTYTGVGGGTVPLTGEIPGSVVDTSTMEGLLDGILGGVTDVVEGVIGVGEAVVALPLAIVDAFADFFNPMDAWEDFVAVGGGWEDIETAANAAMPFCLGLGLGNIGDLYEGDGEPVTVDFVYGTEFTLTPTESVTDITKAVSVMAMAVVMVMWALNRVRKVLGGEGSTSSGD